MGGHLIRIPVSTYKRLEFHGNGLNTPAEVIEKYLNFYEEISGVQTQALIEPKGKYRKLDVEFFPFDEGIFKDLLVANKRAWILLHKNDGTSELREWNAQRFNKDSHLRINLLSGFLRNWKEYGIVKVKIAINKNDLTSV